jgi:hypothetical protein
MTLPISAPDLAGRSSSLANWPADRYLSRFFRRSCWKVPALATLVFLGVAALGAAVGYFLLPAGELGRPAIQSDPLFRWDALKYLFVAQHGYQWGSLLTTARSETAFFPAYPLIDSALGHLFNSWAPALLALPSFLFGIAAIFAFDRLARRLLSRRGATVATFGYALYPAACFTLNGYPTSLINLALILMFTAVIDRRSGRAAGWAGVAAAAGPLAVVAAGPLAVVAAGPLAVVAAGPLAVVAAVAVPLQILAAAVGGPSRGLLNRVQSGVYSLRVALPVSGLALSGLVGFGVYQTVRFGTPTAFLSAQHAWGHAPTGRQFVRALTLFPPPPTTGSQCSGRRQPWTATASRCSYSRSWELSASWYAWLFWSPKPVPLRGS